MGEISVAESHEALLDQLNRRGMRMRRIFDSVAHSGRRAIWPQMKKFAGNPVMNIRRAEIVVNSRSFYCLRAIRSITSMHTDYLRNRMRLLDEHLRSVQNVNVRTLHVRNGKMLIVLFLPTEMDEWLTHNDEYLVARRCAYWLSLRGAEETSNQSGQTVYIPKSQVVSPQTLRALMTRFSRREVINYDA